MRIWKKVSINKIRSGRMLLLSKRTGWNRQTLDQELVDQLRLCFSVWVYLRRAVEGVGVQHRLDHDQGLGQVLSVEVVSVVGTLVRTVVKHLQEGRSPQVEHELQDKHR